MQKRWHAVKRVLRAEGFVYEAVFAERRGHTTELARAALSLGVPITVFLDDARYQK